ncbi:MAG: DUF4013 domain-containing protein [Verrucomicrobiae bacterium]|nr:DUF4013 domain-containing protein [Verrucomicrobiae bacterium]
MTDRPAAASFRFSDLRRGFALVLGDPEWFPKLLLTGILLINPLVVAFAPGWFSGTGPAWARAAFPWLVIFNAFTFWFPLGFTFEVLRRARTGQGRQLPDWSLAVLPRYAREGAVKLVLSLFTLILPVAVWTTAVWSVLGWSFGLPDGLLGLAAGAGLWAAVPFCAVACCRWLDGASVLSAALNYAENWRRFRARASDYLLASAFLAGVNSVTCSLFYTIPIGAAFGLCLVDTWFGPIFAETVDLPSPQTKEGARTDP